jgi:diguanylate cyclase (GGDEF)-like protein
MVWWRSEQERARSAAVLGLVVDPPRGWADRAERIEAIHTAGAPIGDGAGAPAEARRDEPSPEWGVASLTRRLQDVAHSVLPEATLSDITHLLVSEESPAKVLEAVADALAELVPHDSLMLLHADVPLRLLRPVLVRDPYAEEIMAAGSSPFGMGISGLVAETRIPQLVNDAHLDPRAEQIPGTPDEPESMLALPLLAREELKGVLVLSRIGDGARFGIQEFKLAIVFSELAALAIDNAEIRSRLEAEVVTDHLTALYNHRYFHERVAEELRRATRQRGRLGLVLFDLDDFKRINDSYGHLVGDQVLQGVASITRETCRAEDVICRFGGEEFAVILPGGSVQEARAMAERLRVAVRGVSFPTVGRVTISLGACEGPLHAASSRELIACADIALLEAKARGKDRVEVYEDQLRIDLWNAPRRADDPVAPSIGAADGHGYGRGITGRLAALDARGTTRSVAQLRMLQSLSAQLNRLHSVPEIGEAITAELRSLIDYHNCRVYLLAMDEETLIPIAFRGVLTEYEGETFDALLTKVGEGLTGRVAQFGETQYAPDANLDPFAVTIDGTPELDESLLGVPMTYGDKVIGVIVLSKLGIDQFDEEDIRLLEALSASAGVAFENARLLQAERESAQTSAALLELSQALTRVSEVPDVMELAVRAIPEMIAGAKVQAWIRDPSAGTFRLVRTAGFDPEAEGRMTGQTVARETADRFLVSVSEPFVIPKELVAQVPAQHLALPELRDVLVAPMRWDPDGFGAFAIAARSGDVEFTPRDLALARGIADITSLALGNARRFDDLEEAYVSTVEALANALEAQDEYTEDHCRALAQMSIAVGAELGMIPDRLKVLELGALFHDIGKIGVRSEIIRKPGPLTAAERKEMNRHPEIGDRILAPVRFLQAVRPIIRASHERWDGHGYPDGLGAEGIPLESRIVFVCDAFHAMTTDRPYRAALPEREAIRRLRLAAGTQFDPQVVEVFTRLHADGRIHVHERSMPSGSIRPLLR